MTPPLKLVFAGTPVFAERALAALHAAGHAISCVMTRPDKPAKRGHKLVASPVKAWAQAHELPVWQPPTLRDESTWDTLRGLECDLMVVAAYGLILPQAVLDIPRLGCLNIHASLLPRWRGAAPIQRAIQAGDPVTGITIMQMDAGLDTGAIRLMRELPIAPHESGGSVHDRLAELGATAIVEALSLLAKGELPSRPQPAEGVTYAAKIGRSDSVIDWQLGASEIVDQVRAFDPAPGCTTESDRQPGVVLKVWAAREAAPRLAEQAALPAGTVLATGDGLITVACGTLAAPQALTLLEVQRPGGRRMSARDFLAGFAVHPGDRLQAPAAPGPSSPT
jgi:methionyl-tRNA formyltransferase